MDESGQQGPDSQPPSAYAGEAHQTVIQPSASFTQELEANQPQPIVSQQPSATPSNVPLPVPIVDIQPQPPVSPTTSIYPEATSGFGASAAAQMPTVSAGEPQVRATNNTSKALAVRIVAGIIILLGAINAYDWFLEQRAGYTNLISILEIVVVLALAVGIFRLSEVARSLYVVLSAVSLVLTCIGLVTFLASTHLGANSVANTQPLTRTQLENSLRAAESNTSLSAQARQEDIQQLQREINNLSGGSSTDLLVKQYLSTGILIVTAVGPLVFFTRPAIKELFQ